MIVRTSTAQVRPGMFAAFRDLIVAAVSEFPARYDGLLGHEVLLGMDGDELVYVSRWRDEQALVAFAGPAWRTEPVTLPGENDYLLGPLRVRHFTVVEVPKPPRPRNPFSDQSAVTNP